MIAFIEGIIEEKQPTRLVVNAAGVGYEILIPLSSHDRLPDAGQHCRVLTYHYVREDSQQLFGFATAAERDMFVLLLGASGVGPRLALGALSGMAVKELIRAIAEGDTRLLSTISGVGKKTAGRLVLELRDRLESSDVLLAAASGDEQKTVPAAHDAAMALEALGYAPVQARKMVRDALKKLEPDTSVEVIIKQALGQG